MDLLLEIEMKHDFGVAQKNVFKVGAFFFKELRKLGRIS